MAQRLSDLLYEELLSEVRSGRYRSGELLPTEMALCRRSGYSRNTVRQALDRLESDGVIVRIQGKGTFVSRAVEPVPTTGPKNLLGLCMSFADPFMNTVLNNAEAVAKVHGYTFVIASSMGSVEEEAASIRRLIDHGVAGILLLPTGAFETNKEIEKARDLGVPVTVMLRRYLSGAHPAIYFDNTAATADLTRHILRQGYPRVAFVGGPQHDVAPHVDRYRGYCTALEEAGLSVDDDLVLVQDRQDYHHPGSDYQGLKDEVKRFIRSLPLPVGIVAINDERALIVQEAALEAGLKVPEEVGVTGFDDRVVSHAPPVPLTTVRTDVAFMGELAARRLIDEIALGSAVSGDTVIPYRVVIRTSCGERF